MKQTTLMNLQFFALHQYQNGIIIEANQNLTSIVKILWIDSISQEIKEYDSKEEIHKSYQVGQFCQSVQFSSILGIFTGNQTSYLIICLECSKIAQVLENTYFRVESVLHIPFIEYQRKQNKQEWNSMACLQEILQSGFYFALDCDITLSLQEQFQKKPSKSHFQWSHQLIKFTSQYHIPSSWITPIIQGFISSNITSLFNSQLTLIIISRRSRYQAGTRFNCRGIDDFGNVANFVETEQIISYEGKIYSTVMIRGSVPVFWVQEGIMAPIHVTRSLDLSFSAFTKHFQDLNKTYGNVMCINLMGDTKGEQKLNKSFHDLIELAKLDYVKYQYIDFYGVCKGSKFYKINPYLRRLDDQIDNHSCFGYDSITKTILSTQQGVFRINCVDCLDRTNLYMSRLGFLMLEHALKKVNLNLALLSSNQIEDSLNILDDQSKYSLDFVSSFKSIWADNGDQLSQIYSGSNATTSGLTRDGKQTVQGFLQHKIASIERLYKSQFGDSAKQKTIQILLQGMSKNQKTDIDLFMESSQRRFCNYQEFTMYVVTWNVGAKLVKADQTSNLFKFQENLPDIIIIGLQEIVELNVISTVAKPLSQIVLTSEENEEQYWNKQIKQNLQQYGDYINISSMNLVGLYLSIFVKKEHKDRIHKINFDSVKTGFQGKLGNKGSVLARFFIDDSEVIVFNCHLEAGHDIKARAKRYDDIREIHSRAFISDNPSKPVINIWEAEYRIFLGDLNMRADAPYDLVISLINQYTLYKEKGNVLYQSNIKFKDAQLTLIKLIEMDELTKLRSFAYDDLIQQYNEGNLSFLPTYKFDVGGNRYDTSKKQRTPSWCDRILVACKEGLMVKFEVYTSIDLRESDHRPVIGQFVVDVRSIDQAKEISVREEYKINSQKEKSHKNKKVSSDQNSIQRQDQHNALDGVENKDSSVPLKKKNQAAKLFDGVKNVFKNL